MKNNVVDYNSRIAILAGNGKLPIIVINELLKPKCNFVILCFDETNLQQFKQMDDLRMKNNIFSITLSNIPQILSILQQEKIEQVVCCGGVKFKGLNNLNIFNPKFIMTNFFITKYLFQALFSKQKGDNFLLTLVEKILHKIGCKVIAVQEIVPHILINEKDEKNASLSKQYIKDAEYGATILSTISKFDIGQSIVIHDGRVLGVEGAEGTQQLIIRCGQYFKEITKIDTNKKHNFKKPILIKKSKCNQSKKLDVPTIGEQTIIDLIDNDFAGIFLEHNAVFILDREKIAELCKKNAFFIKTI